MGEEHPSRGALIEEGLEVGNDLSIGERGDLTRNSWRWLYRIEGASDSSQDRSTVKRGVEETTAPGSGSWVQTIQFDSSMTPKMPPPRTSTSSPKPARFTSLIATSSCFPTTSGIVTTGASPEHPANSNVAAMAADMAGKQRISNSLG
ncbi:hypothetical protein [Cryobacterium sp. BB307]|uniref:hypothetical protein n=1 Tax=Cryobacterium sp. BB307 TaxID=2716317 RepID=UPI001FF0A888|nr:hypothetical protein [Cryobacterium sp. BB307]